MNEGHNQKHINKCNKQLGPPVTQYQLGPPPRPIPTPYHTATPPRMKKQSEMTRVKPVRLVKWIIGTKGV